MISLIYIGSDFYTKSKTAMSSLYHEFTWERFDFGKIKIFLDQGYEIGIRPANATEMEIAKNILKQYES